MHNNIRHVRKTRNLTQRDLADQLALSVSAISQIERGMISVSVATLVKLTRILDCRACELYPQLSPFQLTNEEAGILSAMRDLDGKDLPPKELKARIAEALERQNPDHEIALCEHTG